jgi:hypothetical protein
MPGMRSMKFRQVDCQGRAAFIVASLPPKIVVPFLERATNRAAKLLTRDEARRIAANFAKLPDSVCKP